MQPRGRLALASLSPQTTPLISPLVLVRVAVGPIQTFVDGNMALYDKLMQTTGLDIELWHVTETAIAGMVARQIIPGISFTTAKAAKKAKLGTPPDANSPGKTKKGTQGTQKKKRIVIRSSYYEKISSDVEFVLLAPVLMVLAGKGFFKKTGMHKVPSTCCHPARPLLFPPRPSSEIRPGSPVTGHHWHCPTPPCHTNPPPFLLGVRSACRPRTRSMNSWPIARRRCPPAMPCASRRWWTPCRVRARPSSPAAAWPHSGRTKPLRVPAWRALPTPALCHPLEGCMRAASAPGRSVIRPGFIGTCPVLHSSCRPGLFLNYQLPKWLSGEPQ